MAYYLIGIGGTGARCVEALIHLCACRKLDQPVHLFLVDPDVSNGNQQQLSEVSRAYINASQGVRSTESGATLLQTSLIKATDSPWSPFGDRQNPSFRNLFQYELLQQQQPALAGLVDVLYTDQEKEALLNEGFLGRPSIGAAVLADAVDLLGGEPWKSFVGEKIRNDSQARIFLVGSVFGGTGASGLPTLARLLANNLEDRRSQYSMGAALVLPYFSFPRDPDANRLQAESEEFVLRSQAALEYYQTRLQGGIYDAVYLLGSSEQLPVGVSARGAEKQKNPPHPVELFAATAALHFFEKHVPGSGPLTHMTARTRGEPLSWGSLPEGARLKMELANLMRFSRAYLDEFHPTLEKLFLDPRDKLQKTRWYSKNFFPQGQSPSLEEVAQQVKTYCEYFDTWYRQIDQQDRLRVNLLRPGRFDVLESTAPNSTIGDVSTALDRYKSGGWGWNTPSDFGRFAHALYYECRQN